MAAAATPEEGKRQAWWLVGAVTALGAALRFHHVLLVHPPAGFLVGDMLQQVHRAYAFLDPHRPLRPDDTLLPPGLMWLGALALKLRPGGAVELLTPVQALLGTAGIPLAFVGLRRFFGERAAILGAALLAIDPLAIGLAGFYLPDTYLAFLVLLAFALLRIDRPLACVLCGAALGAAALFGGPALGLAGVWAGRLALRPPSRRAAAALALGVLAVLAPVSAIVSHDSRRPVLLATGAGAAFYIDHCHVRPVARLDPLEPPQAIDPMLPGSTDWPTEANPPLLSRSSLYFGKGLRCLADAPVAALDSIVRQWVNVLGGWPAGSVDVWPLGSSDDLPWARAGNLVLCWLLFPLALAGLWRKRLSASSREESPPLSPARGEGSSSDDWLPLLPIATVFAVATVFAGSPRLRAPFDPFILGAAAWALLAGWQSPGGERLRRFLQTPEGEALLAGPKAEPARSRRWPAPLAAAAVALLVYHPLTRVWWFHSHEQHAYLLRLFEWMHGWRDGTLLPRWAPDLLGGYGLPTFDFFAPGTFLGSGPLVLLGFPLQVAMKLWLATVGVVGAVGAYLLVRGETGRDDAALVAAVAFVFMPYRQVDLYVRGDLAEYAALCLLPAALWCYRELARCAPERRVRFALGAAATQAAILVTHTLTGQWATEALALVAVVSLLPGWLRGERRAALASGLAMAAAVGLAAFYVVPALLEKKYAHFEILTQGEYLASDHFVPAALLLRFRYFAFALDGKIGDPLAVRMPFSIGIPLVLFALLTVAGMAVAGPRHRLRPTLLWWGAVAVLLFLVTPSSASLWPALPFGSFIGFPWRLLGLVAIFGTVAVGTTWAALVPGSARWRWALAASSVVAIAAEGLHYVQIQAPLQRPPTGLNAVYLQELNHPLCSGEHLPVTATFLPPAPLVELIGTRSNVEDVFIEQPAGDRYDLRATATAPGAIVDVEGYWFPGWEVARVSGPGVPTLAPSPTGVLRVELPVAGQYVLRIEFRHTLARALGELLTLLTLLLVVPVFRWALGRKSERMPA